MKRSPIKAKRSTPRRNEGRVTHARMKPKPSMTKAQAEYHRWLRDLRRCEGCKRGGDLVIHHLLADFPEKRRRDEWYVVLLCPQCHNMGTKSVHLLGSEAKFYEEAKVDLVAVSIYRLRQYCKDFNVKP